MDKNKLIFLDTETTGLGGSSRLCQVAYSFQGSKKEGLFKPPVPIEIDAMVVTHITNKMVEQKESFIGSAMFLELKEIFSQGNILVAHNADYDAGMLQKEGLRIEKTIDTHKIAHYLDENGDIPRHSLQYLRYYFELDIEDAGAHNALDDVRVLEKLFEHYFEKMRIESVSDEVVLDKMLAISKEPILIKKFNFGKYAGEKVSDVAQKDSSYLSWLLNQKIMDRENGINNDENWIYTLDKYLSRNKLF